LADTARWQRCRGSMDGEPDGAVEALIYFDPACSQRLCLTYAELRQQQDAVARALLEQGVGPGELVADFCDDGPGLVLAILGVLRAGATVVPLDPTQPRARLAALLEDCRPALTLCTEEGRAGLASRLSGLCGPPLVALEDLVEAGRALDRSLDSCWQGATLSELSHVIYTSGSTGAPKGVACERRALLAYARGKIARHRIGARSRVLLCSAHTWDPCLGDIVSTLLAGGTLCAAPRGQLVHDLAATVNALQATHLCATPSLLALLAASPAQLPSLERVALGGEPLTRELARPWAAACSLCNTYGVTEAAVYQTLYEMPAACSLLPAEAEAAFHHQGQQQGQHQEPHEHEAVCRTPPACTRAAEVAAATAAAAAPPSSRVLPVGAPLPAVRLALCAPRVAARAGRAARQALARAAAAGAAARTGEGEAEGGTEGGANAVGVAVAAEAEAEAGAEEEAEDEAEEGVGEVLVGGVQLARGYWRRPELTAERFVELRDEELLRLVCGSEAGGDADGAGRRRWFRTGDLGVWVGGAAGLRVLGRLDEQVKLRGMRLELGEVEAAAQSCPLVAAAAAAVADARLVLFVKPKVRTITHARAYARTFS